MANFPPKKKKNKRWTGHDFFVIWGTVIYSIYSSKSSNVEECMESVFGFWEAIFVFSVYSIDSLMKQYSWKMTSPILSDSIGQVGRWQRWEGRSRSFGYG
jgi:hypothetical protein